AGANTKPSSGHADIKVIDGKSDANSAYTQDGQIVIGFLPDSFDAAGKTSISVDVAPLNTCPQPKSVQFVTNIYKITADAPLKKRANVTMLYSNLEPHPDAIYRADDPSGAWTVLERSPQGQPYTIFASSDKRGCLCRGGRRIFLLLDTTQHAERLRIERAWAGAAADRVPALPIVGDGRRFHLEPLFEARVQLGRAQAQLAFAMQLGGRTVRWP